MYMYIIPYNINDNNDKTVTIIIKCSIMGPAMCYQMISNKSLFNVYFHNHFVYFNFICLFSRYE